LVKGGVGELGHEFLLHPSRVGDNRGHRHVDNVASQWSAGMQEDRTGFAERCCPIEGKSGQAPGFSIPPMSRKSVQKFLYQERAVVS